MEDPVVLKNDFKNDSFIGGHIDQFSWATFIAPFHWTLWLTLIVWSFVTSIIIWIIHR